MNLRTPDHRLTAGPRCDKIVPGGGVMSYHCSLPQGHWGFPQDDPEPCYAVESTPSTRAWDAWKRRQEAQEAGAGKIVCPSCGEKAMVLGDAEGKCEHCGAVAAYQVSTGLPVMGQPLATDNGGGDPETADDPDAYDVIDDIGQPGITDLSLPSRSHWEDEMIRSRWILPACPSCGEHDRTLSTDQAACGDFWHEQSKEPLPTAEDLIAADQADPHPGVHRVMAMHELALRRGQSARSGVDLLAEAAVPTETAEETLARLEAETPLRREDDPEWRGDREGGQATPDGDESLEDDQTLLIQDILSRRELGIRRYGQGHRPFNGRNTLQDFYDEHVDALVYLRSLVRMSEATRGELVHVVTQVLVKQWHQRATDKVVDSAEGHSAAMAAVAVDRIMGWVAAQIIEAEVGKEA